MKTLIAIPCGDQLEANFVECLLALRSVGEVEIKLLKGTLVYDARNQLMEYAMQKGGYDFVDVRDVAAGIVACSEHGKAGHGYILSGQYATIRDILNAAKDALGLKRSVSFLPICFAKLIAPLYEKRSLRKKQTLYFTPYAVSVLDSNSKFSRAAAAASFGYAPRSLQSSIRDTVLWLKKPAIE